MTESYVRSSSLFFKSFNVLRCSLHQKGNIDDLLNMYLTQDLSVLSCFFLILLVFYAALDHLQERGGGAIFFVVILLSGPRGNFTKARYMSCS